VEQCKLVDKVNNAQLVLRQGNNPCSLPADADDKSAGRLAMWRAIRRVRAMAIREILIYPDDRLRDVARPVEFPLSDEIRQLIDDMAETMYDAPGVGLAATQIGVALRIAITDTDWRSDEVRHNEGEEPVAPRNLKVWINPEFTWRETGLATWEEGCLSVPDVYEDVERPAAVRLKWQDMDGEVHEEEFEGFQAVALQHEFDHLDGILFIDKLSRLKQNMIKKKLKKRKKLQRL